MPPPLSRAGRSGAEFALLGPAGLAILAVLLLACTPRYHFQYEIPRSLAAEPGDARSAPRLLTAEPGYFVWLYRGEFHLFSTPAQSRNFGRHPDNTRGRKVQRLGPNGETVVFEDDPARPEISARLEKRFRETPQLLRQWDNTFFVWKYQSRLFVIGDPLTSRLFGLHRHLPYTKTLFQAGPHGETVIFEVRKGKPDFTARLIERYREQPQLVEVREPSLFVWHYKDRIYLLASRQSSLRFERSLALPASEAFLAGGPNGETVVVEKNRNDPDQPQRLFDRFRTITPAGKRSAVTAPEKGPSARASPPPDLGIPGRRTVPISPLEKPSLAFSTPASPCRGNDAWQRDGEGSP